MERYHTVIGMDPSMNHWGLVKGTIDLAIDEVNYSEIACIEPSRVKLKKERQNEIDLINFQFLVEEVVAFVGDADLIFAETPVGSQSARASVGYGVCLGLLAAFRSTGRTLHSVSAANAKLVATGDPTASKKEVTQAMYEMYPHLNWPTRKYKGEITPVHGKAEHMADAVATLEAGLLSDQFREYIQPLRHKYAIHHQTQRAC